jgi:serine protease
VNTINATSNAALFVDNDTGVRDTQMDGFTIPLECVASVNPGVPNHVKIAIADTADAAYDAAVFLAAGGVRSPGSGAPTVSSLARVVEYHHADFDHYFITALPAEIQKLDDGTFSGWTRTGQVFNVFVSGTAATAEVCRFFSTSFAPRSSHFYTPSAAECDTVKKSGDWSFEAAVFNVNLPAGDGSCQAGTQPLFRAYNDGQGGAPNHRYTTDRDTFLSMQQLGWKPEGYGEGVIACVPM